ncbi:DNA repair protein UVH3 isoform X2 [Macadamia integrifolia]|uniref:DNA repair protein UVH3 isoform X2 n=1 Tax=Macadamia integrifolia TaxID=60698 RepID=UPI001C4F6048|nr:DNA repair protein UVH3 isoform X2 [Macadamia integrifolia]
MMPSLRPKIKKCWMSSEEDGSLSGNASTSFGGIPSEENDGDDDEEMILPVMHGSIDPSILAVLPPSMQLDLLVQMRENLIAENRQKYQKAKKAPAKFSQLQIQAYLKTVAFRREIDEVQKSAAGRGVGGVQTSRIASEANREFIFSSSFTGDKQTLTSAGVEKNGDMEHQTPRTEAVSSDFVNHISSASKGNSATGSTTNESRGDLHDDVETYLDDSGRVRVSRVRAMGIRMTRDLQRNLDLMKEIEQEKTKEKIFTNMEAISNEQVVGVQHDSSNDGKNGTISINDGMDSLVQGESPLTNEQSVLGNKAPMVISFFEDDNGNKCAEDDVDNLFASLVAGDSVIPSAKVVPSEKHPSADSECSWEEGSIEETNCSFSNDAKEEAKQTLTYDDISDEAEVDWEEGVSDVPELASPQKMAVSKGSLEEAAAFEEAIRISLEDFTAEKSINVSAGTSDTEISRQVVSQSTSNKFFPQTFALEKDCSDTRNLPLEDNFQQNPSSCEDVDDLERLNNAGIRDMLHIVESPNMQLKSSSGLEVKTDGKEVVTDQSQLVSDVGRLSEETVEDRNVCVDAHSTHQVTSKEPNEDQLNSKTSDANVVDASENESEAIPSFVSCETTDNAISQARYSIKEIATDTAMDHNLVAEKDYGVLSEEREQCRDAIEDKMEASKTALDQELLHLRQERINLGDEQRKLERNAESVSSEMFAECQELLQMFGLPYIIAPMEAEAQCAYMERSNLVDGVVTDDSDVLLFGARNVFKNIFDDRKYVETYFMKDIESELGLSRDKLIRMALLLGSDYTEGISGIGIVNAIEVAHAFPEEDGLQKFREWLESPDPSILGKLNVHTGSTPRKRSSKVNNNNLDCLQDSVGGSTSDGSVSKSHDNNQSMDDNHTIKKIFMDKHRNVSKNWNIPSSFPSEAVISAYASPQVDKSTEPFSWGKPDLFVLRKLCSEKFGWSNQKADELLVPVLKEYSKHETQLRLEAFYSFNERFAKIRSKRIKKAVKGITGNQASGFVDDLPEESSKAAKKRRVDPRGPNENEPVNSLYQRNDTVTGDDDNVSENSTKKQSEKKGIGSEPEQSAVGHPDLAIWEESRQKNEERLRRDGRGRGRGKGRGGRGMGQGKRKASPAFVLTESSPSDSSNDEQEVQGEDTGRLTSVRRSTRSRKHVKYASKDPDDSESSDQSNEKGRDDGAVDQEPEHDKDMPGHAVEDSCEDNHYIGGCDRSLNNDLCKDYLEVGGGFCEDEGEHKADPLQQVSCQPISKPGNGDLSLDGFSKDYLEVGGGFCEDEGEQDADPLQQVSCQPKTGDGFCMDKAELDDDQTHSVSSPPRVHDIHLDDTSGIRGSNDPSEQELPKEDSGPTSTTGLRCMPFLRRKRRKT